LHPLLGTLDYYIESFVICKGVFEKNLPLFR